MKSAVDFREKKAYLITLVCRAITCLSQVRMVER